MTTCVQPRIAGRTTGLLAVGLAGALAVMAAAETTVVLNDVTQQAGIRFHHTDGSSGRHYIVESVCCGLATFDYDGDGLIDIYFLNGAPLRGAATDGPPPRNALYRNLGDWQFTDVTDQAGVGDTGYGLGVTVGDYDNDGYPDLYLNNYGPNVLYHNNGDGTFTDVTAAAGVGAGDKVGAGACFLDMDGNGQLDLYVANYVKFTYDNHVERTFDGYPEYAGPKDYEPEPDMLFRNNGDGTFTDVSLESGIGARAGSGMGMVCADYDDDQDTDIFVLNDVAGNFLFQNDGHGRFEEVALLAGVGYNGHGHELGSMGVDCGDYDHDGRLDFYMTSYSGEMPVLYRNLGGGTFDDVTLLTGAGRGCFRDVNWGTGFIDLDNDSHRDLFVANGHLQDNIDQYDGSTSYRATNVVLKNMGDGRFADVSANAGAGMRVKLSSRGAALDDLDNNGQVDLVVLNSRSPATVLRNESRTDNHWLQVRLCGTRTNRDGVGARVTVTTGTQQQIAEVHSGRGYQGHFGSRLHFGLGQHTLVDRIEVRWIGGGTEVIEMVGADQLVTIVEASPSSRD